MLRLGSHGQSVAFLQTQLNVIGKSAQRPLAADGIFGALTDRRVREFQRTPPNSLAADGIVGPLTQGKILGTLLSAFSEETPSGPHRQVLGFAGGSGSGGGTQSGATASVGLATATESRQDALNWARQVEQFWSALPKVHAHTVTMGNKESVDSAAQKIERAANLAGKKGVVFLSAGHGFPIANARGRTDEGMFQLAPSGFDVVGNNAFQQLVAGKAQVSVFYNVRPPAGRGIIVKSDKENDEEKAKKGNAGAQKRLKNFNRFVALGQNLRGSGIAGIVLVTCRVASATDFLKRSRQLLGVPIMAYTRRVAIQVLASQRTRFFLEGDAPNQGTNVAMGEIFVPAVGAKPNDIVTFL